MEKIERVARLEDLVCPDDAVFVIDERVADRHQWTRTPTVKVRAGESLKTLEAAGRLAEQILARRSTRPMTIVAIGGGSVGDAVGFVASTLWRGVDLWHVPTTLLAAVDSAHGGKTALNLGNHKNQLGTFYPASVVVIVEEVLAALPPTVRADGMAEVIKGLWLGDAAGVAELDQSGTDRLAYGPWEDVGAALLATLDRAIRVKQEVVARDPRETRGIRTLLNLGHTLAHALELEEGFSHGRAVAWGLAAAGWLSQSRGLLLAADYERLWSHVYPLLGSRLPGLRADRLACALRGDKKRVDAKLRSVLLRGPGDAFVVDDVSDTDWFEALNSVRQRVDAPLCIEVNAGTRASVTVEASKSIMNRLLAIQSLRPGPTTLVGDSSADDVRRMRAAITALQEERVAYAGEGGTTYRFLLALAAAGRGSSTIQRSASLSRRPHEPLNEALIRAGATIAVVDDTVTVGPLPDGELTFEVDSSASSQFASALALIAASGRKVTLRLQGAVASRPYFEMTLALLEACGVQVVTGGDDTIVLTPTPLLEAPVTLTAEPDASSAAVWVVAAFLGLDVDVAEIDSSLQPDARVREYLWESSEEEVSVDLSDAPDLAPVLAVAAALTQPRVRLVGASHLRFKESNRIEDLVNALACVGIDAKALEDGVEIPKGVQVPTPGATFPTHGDHRLAMAGCLLALRAPLVIEHPTVVSKSYPEFWQDAMIAGFRVETGSA